ncbi:PRC-barrel domain-containing protein [Streptomyces sp. NPDC058953]|uniref:PRC-barrel domain-containing protein n=1 Tax=unclassified Streptomyces TaxID=2593676 RepID=UPI0036C8015D
MQTDIDPRSLIGRKAYDRDGVRIGTVDEVYLDDATGSPDWAAVRTGLFGRDSFVPLAPSTVVEDTLRVPFERSLIKTAPDFGVGRHLSPAQELQLCRHYGIEVSAPSAPPSPPASSGPVPDRSFGTVAGEDGPPGGSPGRSTG